MGVIALTGVNDGLHELRFVPLKTKQIPKFLPDTRN
jgi:hypothetical protein